MGESLGTVEKFTEGRWLEQRVTPAQIVTGKVLVRATNTRTGSNAVISIVEWVEAKEQDGLNRLYSDEFSRIDSFHGKSDSKMSEM